MTQNATLIFDSLFLHDTQMADLEREQTALRKLHSKLTAERASTAGNDSSTIDSALPFNFAPPFCPLPQGGATAGSAPPGKLTIGALIASGGWIVRPVTPQANGESSISEPGAVDGSYESTRPIDVCGYPPLPDGRCFILGYAGDFAEALIERARSGGISASKTGFGSFSVSARYRATMTIEIAYEKGTVFSCVRTVGAALWEKA
jgi:hypothetical protein